jgi:hypothetical protein
MSVGTFTRRLASMPRLSEGATFSSIRLLSECIRRPPTTPFTSEGLLRVAAVSSKGNARRRRWRLSSTINDLRKWAIARVPMHVN